MRTTLLTALILSALTLAATPTTTAETIEICNGQPPADWIPCSSGLIIRICGEETVDLCQMF